MVGNLTASDIIIGPIPGKPRAENVASQNLDGFHPGLSLTKRFAGAPGDFEKTSRSFAVRMLRHLLEFVCVGVVLFVSALFVSIFALVTPVIVGASAVLGMMGIAPDFRWRAATQA